LRIGLSHALAEGTLIEPIQALTEKYPKVRLRLSNELTGELINRLLEQTVVEVTSGNMGTGLAIVCAVKGYRVVAVMSRGNAPERAQMMRALGAEVVLVDQAPGTSLGQVSGEDLKLVEIRAQEITRERAAFRADQFVRAGNWHAHAETTGPEIVKQAGRVDSFCDFVRSGGTFRGCAQALRAANLLCGAM
jgi:cysteine synthase A